MGHEGYPFWKLPVRVEAVVSIAMPNHNSGIRDAPVDAPHTHDALVLLLRRKFAAALEAAAEVRAAVVVVPDIGCGVYKNPPGTVGEVFGRVVREMFPRTFSEIHLVGSREFCQAVQGQRL